MISIGEALFDEAELAPVAKKPVFCLECKRNDVPDHNWRCTGCGVSVKSGFARVKCERCGNETFGVRRYDEIRSLCRCHYTPSQREQYQRAIERNEIEQRAEQAAYAAARSRAIEKKQQREQADRCLAFKQQCSVRFDSPTYDFCKSCRKFADKKTAEVTE